MRIVVLDGHTLNPGDLSWGALAELGELTVHERTPADQTVTRAAGAAVVLTNKAVLSAAQLAQMPDCRYLGVLATGYNIVDTAAAAARGIPVTNIPIYGTTSVAQMVFAHLLNLTQHVAEHAAAVRDGAWGDCPDFCFWNFPLVELSGRTMGIVGYGRIGRATAQLASAFGMSVLAYDPIATEAEGDHRLTDLETLFRQSDVVSLHCPLTPETDHLVGARLLGLMKPTAFLLNTSRGPLIDQHALAEALAAGKLAGAGIDVLEVEPPTDNPLLSAPNCYVTPHISWATREARARLMKTAVENVQAFLDGQPVNVVNGVG